VPPAARSVVAPPSSRARSRRVARQSDTNIETRPDRAVEEAEKMSKIHIVRRHTLSLHDARAEVERIAQRMEHEFGADYAWDGDTLCFARSGVSGHITVTSEQLDLTVRLGLLLSAMKGQIEQQIAAKVDETLAARGAVPPADDNNA
jgi:putative polyhydroxyalkanoate system protein